MNKCLRVIDIGKSDNIYLCKKTGCACILLKKEIEEGVCACCKSDKDD